MFSLFRKKEKPPMVFGTADAAFDYACFHLDYPLRLDAVIPALVREKGRVGEEGEQYYLLHLATRNGGVEVWGCTLAHAPGRPDIGDMVGFRVVRYEPELPLDLGLMGYISAVLQPVLVEDRGWRIDRNLTPADLKPVLRL